MTKMEIEKSYGICGLVCALCGYNENCAGCQGKDDDCDIKACCCSKDLGYCYLCNEWPCNKNMHKNIRIRAFNSVAKTEGLDKLAEYLHNNHNRGITYHKPDGLPGDYDKCKTEQEVIELLKNGRPDPYTKCPEYETKNFILRLVSMDDAEDLLLCYSDPEAQKFFNSDNCISDFKYYTLEEMQTCLEFWLDSYRNKYFLRFSIVDKNISKAVGTIEIFGSEHGGERADFGVLRIDIRHEYENEEALIELIGASDSFFYDVNVEMFITKAIPEASHRINALLKNGYISTLIGDGANREHYYMKNSPVFI